MNLNNELTLLIKSRYPVVFVETLDESYVITQLVEIARQLNLILIDWSVTEGLRRDQLRWFSPDSQEPAKALTTVRDYLNMPGHDPFVLVLNDFYKNLSDPVVLRLFKDVIVRLQGTRTTIVMIGSHCDLPREIESCAARVTGSYPDESEVIETIGETCKAFAKASPDAKIELNHNDEKRLVRGLKGMTLQQVRNIVNRVLVEDHELSANDFAKIDKLKKEIFDREGMLELCTSEKAANIAGFENMKSWLSCRRLSFQQGTGALPPPKGMLLMGVQGCGKSLAVRAIASELNLPLYRLDPIRWYSKYIGETEQNLRKALSTVDHLAPVCLWIDEIEKAFASSTGEIDGGVSQRLLGTFLTWMQERTTPSFLAATANDIQVLPPEFVRKGRFDEIFFVDLPNQATRELLFKIHLGKRKLDAGQFDCAALAEMTDEFSGAEIEQAIISALYRAAGTQPFTMNHIAAEIKSTKPLATIKAEEIKALRLWARDRTVSA